MNKKELQEALLARGELAEKIEGMSVGELRVLWEEVEDEPVLEVEVEEVKTGVTPDKLDSEVLPKRTDPEWQSFIMSQFADGEFYRDKKTGVHRPTVHGLRRLVEKFIGPILVSEVSAFQTPNSDTFFATCGWTIEVFDMSIGDRRRVTDIADHHPTISDGVFKLFPSSNAATKAEGRALRKLLNINVACTEEMANITDEEVEEVFSKNNGKITPSQITVIKQLCKRIGMTVSDFMDGDPIESLDYSEAQDAMEHLNKLIKKGK